MQTKVNFATVGCEIRFGHQISSALPTEGSVRVPNLHRVARRIIFKPTTVLTPLSCLDCILGGQVADAIFLQQTHNVTSVVQSVHAPERFQVLSSSHHNSIPASRVPHKLGYIVHCTSVCNPNACIWVKVFFHFLLQS